MAVMLDRAQHDALYQFVVDSLSSVGEISVALAGDQLEEAR